MNFSLSKIISKLHKNKDFSEVLSGSAYGFFFKLTGLLLGYIFMVLIARNYGPEGLGVLTLTITVLSISVVIVKVGVDINLMKWIARYNEKNLESKIKSLYLKSVGIIFFIGSIVSTVLFFYSGWMALIVFKKDNLVEPFYLISILLIPLAILHLNSEVMRGYKKVSYYFVLNSNLISFFGIVLIIFNLQSIFSKYTQIDIYIVATLLATIVSIFLIFTTINFKQHVSSSSLPVSKLIIDSFPIMITSSLMMLMGWTDVIMIGVFMTEYDVGVYTAALKLALLTSLSLIAVNSILAPKISYMHSIGDEAGMKVVVMLATKLIFFTSLPVLFVFMVAPEFFLNIFGQEFKRGAIVLMILSIGQLINSMSGPVGHILNMTDRQVIFQYIMLISVLLNITLNYLLIPMYGIEGAAISTAASTILWNLLSVVYIHKKFGLTVIYIPFFNRK